MSSEKIDDSYCLIRLHMQKNIVLYFFYSSQHTSKYPICVTSSQADIIYCLISLHHYFHYLSLNHYLYLGQELYKAELALQFNQLYIQN